jgi:hypothetical protein
MPLERPSRAPAYIAYGLGAAGLGVGIGFGLSAMSDKNDLDDACVNKVCPPDEQDKLDSAKLKGTISTIGFAVGGVGIALGTILIVSSSGSDDVGHAPSGRRAGKAPDYRLRAMVGPGSVRAALDF